MTQKSPTSGTAGGRAGLRPLELAVLALFFVSGASALIYEVVWTRELTTVFGGSAFAIATVLAAYMAGLALGSTVFGRSIDRRGHPLAIYGILEGGIGVWALLLPALLALLDRLYAGIYRSLDPGFYLLSLIRFVLSFLLLLVPTTLMGGTLPVLGKLLLRNWKGLGTRAGLLYGANTLGAVLGTAAGGFLLLPALGLSGTTYVAVAFNALVAGAALLASRRFPWRPPVSEVSEKEAGPPRPTVESASPGRLRRTVLAVYAASGFAALAYEVAWTKTLSMILGTTNYAFTCMLTTFLLGLAVGSFIFARIADRHGRPAYSLALVQLGIPVLALGTIPVLGDLPQLFVNGYHIWGGSWASLEFYKVLLAAMVMFLPTVLMGATFPLVTRAYVDRRAMGRSLGSLYASNTVGAILGSFLTGFVFVPWLGRQNSILVASFVNVAAAAALLVALRTRAVPARLRWTTAVLAVLLVPVTVLGLRRWDPRLMASGAYVYVKDLAKYPSILDNEKGSHIEFYDEATEATISVWHADYVSYLSTNGKVEASSVGDMGTQKIISHLPVLYHRGPVHSGLMIGLASGISVGSLLTYPFDKVETVELIPSMVDAAHYFDLYNHRCLEDPRHRLIINDGRNHLLLTGEKYDVIVSEPSNPWIAGVGALFTREYFELVKKRLKPGGVACQWIQTYQFNQDDLKTILGTFVDAFPYVQLWEGEPTDLVVVAGMEPLTLDLDQARQYLKGAPGKDLDSIEMMPLSQLLAHYVTDRAGILAYVGDHRRRVTDDNLYLEYSVPRHMLSDTDQVNVLQLSPYLRSPFVDVPPGQADTTLTAAVDRFRAAHLLALRVRLGAPLPAETPTPEAALREALRIAPEERLARAELGKRINEKGMTMLQQGDYAGAEPVFRDVLEHGADVERALALSNLGTIAFNTGRPDSAEVYWRKALQVIPDYVIPMQNLAQWEYQKGDYAAAAALLRKTIPLDGADAATLNDLAYYEAMAGDHLDDAEDAARRAVAQDPSSSYLDTLGLVLFRRQRYEEAEKILLRAHDKDPGSMEALLHLGMARAARGRLAEAREDLNRVAGQENDPDLARQAREQLEKL